ncbi:MAG: hypothetical protein M3406_15530 [Chloroflexota bacterium]|nr:hypothetical protein [Chloroflexota bacterium]
MLGLALDDDTDAPQLMAWLAEGGRSGGKTAAIVHDVARSGVLPDVWERHPEGVLLAATERIESHDRTDVLSWFMQRLEELERAGLMRLLTEAGAAAPVAHPAAAEAH